MQKQKLQFLLDNLKTCHKSKIIDFESTLGIPINQIFLYQMTLKHALQLRENFRKISSFIGIRITFQFELASSNNCQKSWNFSIELTFGYTVMQCFLYQLRKKLVFQLNPIFIKNFFQTARYFGFQLALRF